jgi:hypothetical protein
MVFRMPPPVFFVFSLEQEVAGEISGAFTGCSGFGNILRSLEGRSDTVPAIKPQAVKKRKFTAVSKAAVAKAKKAAVPKAKKAAVPKAGAVPKPAAKAAVPKPAAVAAVGVAGAAVSEPAAPVAKPAKAPVKDTRKCVHSRAYKAAAAVAKAAGLNAGEISLAACKAGKEAAAKWDLEHPDP